MSQARAELGAARDVFISLGKAQLEGELNIPSGARGIVLFAHGSGSSRHSARNKYVARTLHDAEIGTLLFELLTEEEGEEEKYTRHLRFDIDLQLTPAFFPAGGVAKPRVNPHPQSEPP